MNLFKHHSKVLQLLRKNNSFYIKGLLSGQGECHPFLVDGHQVGLIRPDTAVNLEKYPDVFAKKSGAFLLNPQIESYESRSKAVESVLRDLKVKDDLVALRRWRGEDVNVWSEFGRQAFFKIDRSGSPFLGCRSFAVHLNGYTRTADGSLFLWLQKRSEDAVMHPGLMDSIVGGCITAGLSPFQVLLKEAQEEASIPANVVEKAKFTGTVSFFSESEVGLHPHTEFVYDLQLDPEFIPKNSDGEAVGFELVAMNDVLEKVLSPFYAITSTPVAIDFLIRHGIINPETDPGLPEIVELLHVPLQQLYKKWQS